MKYWEELKLALLCVILGASLVTLIGAFIGFISTPNLYGLFLIIISSIISFILLHYAIDIEKARR